jgi:hypothetical protein
MGTPEPIASGGAISGHQKRQTRGRRRVPHPRQLTLAGVPIVLGESLLAVPVA